MTFPKNNTYPRFTGLKHKPESNAKRSAAMKALYASGRPEGMGFEKKYQTPEEAKAAHAMANRKRQLKCRYGISLEQYDAMLSQQGGGCEICSARSAHPNKQSPLHVDHNHKTGVVRGLLCARCNKALGFLERVDSHRVLAYLNKYEKRFNHE